MAIWTTSKGSILWLANGRDVYVEIDPVTMSVRMIHEPSSYSYEDELYEWTVFVADGDLLKRQKLTQYGEEPRTTVSTAVEGLVPMSGTVAVDAEREAQKAFAAYQGGRRMAAIQREAEDQKREVEFLDALPDSCQHLVFRKVGRGWSVSLRGAAEPFWTTKIWPWRGTDLHAILRRSLANAGREVESFTTDLVSLDDEMCYYGE